MTNRLEPTDPAPPPASEEQVVPSEETVRRGDVTDESVEPEDEESDEPTGLALTQRT